MKVLSVFDLQMCAIFLTCGICLALQCCFSIKCVYFPINYVSCSLEYKYMLKNTQRDLKVTLLIKVGQDCTCKPTWLVA